MEKTATSILEEARDIVGGERHKTHGDRERSFTLIAELWTIYLSNRVDTRHGNNAVTAFDVAQMMVLLKIARSIQGTPLRDHAVDAAGYAAIAGELAP